MLFSENSTLFFGERFDIVPLLWVAILLPKCHHSLCMGVVLVLVGARICPQQLGILA